MQLRCNCLSQVLDLWPHRVWQDAGMSAAWHESHRRNFKLNFSSQTVSVCLAGRVWSRDEVVKTAPILVEIKVRKLPVWFPGKRIESYLTRNVIYFLWSEMVQRAVGGGEAVGNHRRTIVCVRVKQKAPLKRFSQSEFFQFNSTCFLVQSAN